MRFAWILLFTAFLPSPGKPTSSAPMTPVLKDVENIARVDASQDGRLRRSIRDLVENRFDADALPNDTPFTAWTTGNDLLAFQVGDLFATRAVTSTDAPVVGGEHIARERWVFHDGTSLDGPTLSRPVRYHAISSRAGFREHPIRRRIKFHSGTDYAAPIGTPVHSIKNGVATKVTRSWSGGKFVVIKHDDGSESKYLHLSQHARDLKQGARVLQGEVIGAVGMTGRATGPHLHFELRDADRRLVDPVDTRWPASLHITDTHTLAALEARRELLDAFDEFGVNLRHPLFAARPAASEEPAADDVEHALLPALARVRSRLSRARSPRVRFHSRKRV